MASPINFHEIDHYITQLTAIEDAFNVYRNTVSLQEIQRLNADEVARPFLRKWLDIANLPETDDMLAQLKTTTFNVSRLSPYFDIMLHCQKEWTSAVDLIHIVYVYRGSFACQMKQQTFPLEQGNCYMFNVNISKQIQPCQEDAQLLNCLISQNYLENILLKQFDRSILFSDFLTQSFYTDSSSEPMLAFHTAGDPNVRYAFAMAIIEQLNQLPLCQSMIASHVSALMVHLVRLHMERRDEMHYLQLGKHKLSDILIYIDQHCNTATLDSIAETFHFHPSYLSKIIKHHTGLTFTNILQHTRLNKAALMLKNADCSITDVAHQVGYNNISYFYKLFQNKYGVTPAAYRNSRES